MSETMVGAYEPKSAGSSIGPYSFEEFIEAARAFHNYPAPGLLLGGIMVDEAMRHMPEGVLFDAISETSWCLPDAVQMLTPCTIGNGWLKVINLGRYAVTLYDKHTGEGVRIGLDQDELAKHKDIDIWLMKKLPKPEQDSDGLREAIRLHGRSLLTIQPVQVRESMMQRRGKGAIGECPICKEAYPLKHGGVCRGCQGEAPYASESVESAGPALRAVPLSEAVGRRIAHDVTRVEPGVSKGVFLRKGQMIDIGDVCRLQQIGRANIYLEENQPEGDWVHEDTAAEAFAKAMSGPGVVAEGSPREGKVNLIAEEDGLFLADVERLERFNCLPQVMAACRKSGSVVTAGTRVAGTRAIPLYISSDHFRTALGLLESGPLFSMHPLAKPKTAVLITGTEVFEGRIEDKFAETMAGKLGAFGIEPFQTMIEPDDADRIAAAVERLAAEGCELLLTTAGLSVDPDDVTRQGLVQAGVTDMLYGMPVLPGAMTLVARRGPMRILGTPACALFHKTTSLDILLPRLLAGLEITRANLSSLANGGLCRECRVCVYPKCSFGT